MRYFCDASVLGKADAGNHAGVPQLRSKKKNLELVIFCVALCIDIALTSIEGLSIHIAPFIL